MNTFIIELTIKSINSNFKINYQIMRKIKLILTNALAIVAFGAFFLSFNLSVASEAPGAKRYSAIGEDGVIQCFCNKEGKTCECQIDVE